MTNHTNTSELKEFVEDQNLSDKNSNIFFNAQIELTTSKNFVQIESKVMIRFDGYNSSGKLTIIGSELNPHLFPEEFEANWQTFKYHDNQYLQITGNHPKKEIGKYKVDITPIEE
ncbi:hypothetical protein [Tenacibaculum discolor]|uniref:hypothetical protein n=1 Tax=Tenacibaculum discolor TaxID=361581 RepID=UPI000EB5184A|nr:hypothetical protein [Tenacibaculum discolor]RLK00102.1 hypothetical protein C8N27_1786 [Tenacibaculum discolor]